jgi:hypothetical protein
MHQIRRHLKHLHHPVIGDANYAMAHNRFFRQSLASRARCCPRQRDPPAASAHGGACRDRRAAEPSLAARQARMAGRGHDRYRHA